MSTATNLIASGYVPIADLAAKVGWSTERIRRRLVAANSRLGGKLLVRFGDTRQARFYADVEMLRVHLPALVRGVDVMDPAVEAANRLEAIETRLRDVQDRVSVVHDVIASAADQPPEDGE